METALHVIWLYTGDDGRSHFGDLDVPMHDMPVGQASAPLDGGRVLLRAVQDDRMDFHPAPMRQFVVHLTGVTEVECGDGAIREFTRGEVMLADDTTGEGHITRWIGPCSHVFVGLSPDVDVVAWRVQPEERS